MLLHVDDYDDADNFADDFDDVDDYDDDQYDNPINDDGASLSDDLPENEIFPEDVNQGKKNKNSLKFY